MSENQAPAETRETDVPVGRAQTMVSYWNDEAQRYNQLADAGFGEVAAGHRIMAEDAREMAAAYQAVVDLTATRRALEDAEAEARLRGETIDALRKELAAEQENNTLIAQAANFNAVLAVEELRVEALGDTLHTANDGRVRGLCANCLTWHFIGDMWAECRACFDETTGKAAQRALADVTRERDEVKQWAMHEAKAWHDYMTELRGKARDLATARAALEDVRRVEEWLHEDHGSTRKLATNGEGRLSLLDTYAQSEWRAYSIEALGRALAQEAGDAKK